MIKMEIIQYIIIIFALFALTRALLMLKKNKLTPKKFFSWFILWIAVIAVGFIPGISTLLSKPLGISRGADFLVYISILVLFYLIYRIYVKLDKIDREITKIVRNIALKREKKD